jgi:thiol-disulfide isomerase/thioredoxin
VAPVTTLADGDALRAFVGATDRALVELRTAGCPACESMAPVLANAARASDVPVAVLDLGGDAALVENYGVRSVPTLLLFVDGDLVARLADGFVGTETLLAFIRSGGAEPASAEPV